MMYPQTTARTLVLDYSFHTQLNELLEKFSITEAEFKVKQHKYFSPADVIYSEEALLAAIIHEFDRA
ncbi:MAG: hypothetical protein IJ668_05725 [Selenomonadaceae bacterium]|nr:hypothetical protein [Selenomonadaceae bacterium]MBR1579979.1 hypothetical protein [Selenomonadaceae bacterium]